MARIKKNLKGPHDRQEIYAYKNMTTREFKVGENVLLRVIPRKSSLNFGICTKLVTRFS
jgi:hypothetical protein